MENNYGILLKGNDIKRHRSYFQEMTKFLGVNCLYYVPKSNKDYDRNGDLFTAYEKPIVVGCIFQDHPDQKTLKKMGWVAELQESSSVIHVPYDLQGLQAGALFVVPSGLDHAEGRVFRVVSMQNIMMYPASIACEIAPEYATNGQRNEVEDLTHTNFTVLKDNEGDD